MVDNSTTPAPVVSPIDVEKRVGQYVMLRDRKAEIKAKHDAELKPVNDTMEMIKDELKQALAQVSGDGIKTAAGTVSLLNKVSVSTADINAFWTWVVTQGLFDMLDKKPNVTAITEYVQQHGVPPPGVNFSTFTDVGVRRKEPTDQAQLTTCSRRNYVDSYYCAGRLQWRRASGGVRRRGCE